LADEPEKKRPDPGSRDGEAAPPKGASRSRPDPGSRDGEAAPPKGASRSRPVPDYDGRGAPPPTPGAARLYVPRVVRFPLYVVSEYGLRRPFEWLIINGEKGQWPALILDFFTFEDRKIGVFPTGLVDFGFRPSAGVYFFWDDAFFEKNGLR